MTIRSESSMSNNYVVESSVATKEELLAYKSKTEEILAEALKNSDKCIHLVDKCIAIAENCHKQEEMCRKYTLYALAVSGFSIATSIFTMLYFILR